MSKEQTNVGKLNEELLSKKKFSFSYVFAFILATVSITKFFGSYRFFRDGEALMGFFMVVAMLSIFIASMTFMSYRIYSEEKDRNNLRMNFFFFDWIYYKLQSLKNHHKINSGDFKYGN